MANRQSNEVRVECPKWRRIQLGPRQLQLLQMSAEMSLMNKRVLQYLLRVLLMGVLDGLLKGMENLNRSRSTECQQRKGQK